MAQRPRDYALRRVVAELAAASAEDVEAVLAELDPAQRRRVEALLAEYASATITAFPEKQNGAQPDLAKADTPQAPEKIVPLDTAGLSSWLTDLLHEDSQALSMTPQALKALRASVSAIAPASPAPTSAVQTAKPRIKLWSRRKAEAGS